MTELQKLFDSMTATLNRIDENLQKLIEHYSKGSNND